MTELTTTHKMKSLSGKSYKNNELSELTVSRQKHSKLLRNIILQYKFTSIIINNELGSLCSIMMY